MRGTLAAPAEIQGGEVHKEQHRRPALNPIPVRHLFGGLDATAFKLHCAVVNEQQIQPIDVLANDWDEWVGWSRWRGATDHFNRDFIFTMARERKSLDRWLFGGVFKVVGRQPIPNSRSYDLELRDDIMGEYIKRLVIEFRPPGRNKRLNLESHLDRMVVAAIHDRPYEGEEFPGVDNIDHSLRQLRTVIEQNRPDWRSALEAMKGVYVIHDQATGAPYVGAAYGDTGIWQRLCAYATTLHGGNVELKALIEAKGENYALDNLRFALLEFLTLRTDDQRVIDREVYWKNVLASRRFGNNRN
ncbi:GIY-YIG nuclease family protein [Mycolicibacterium sp. XJ2546]